ncbi:NDR1/HIN1-like protein 13 [Neltuma alba]|uniref:NDR1/HIN1-like protein 13 n=1 Tax=Neltuma alba TaxID=207710 RepID=UPI0010A46073|nr:NDR1/HIN1-like protein 13 [Prosopis alba]
MASPPLKPVLQKPPGYRDPNNPQQPKPRPPLARKPVLPLSLRSKKQRRRRYCRKCCCVFCVFILILIVALIVAASLIYIVYDPQPPVFHLQSFRVNRLNVTQKTDGVYLDASTVTRVEVKNPNSKIQWYFGQTMFGISTDDGNVNLGEKTIPAFSIKAKEVTLLKAETRVKDQILLDSEGKNLRGKFRSREFVPSVEVQTRVGMSVQSLKIGTVGISVVCGEVTLKKLEGGAMPKCTITLLKWIKIQ